MLRYLRKVDDYILDHVFQPITWRIEYVTGWNNFTLARAVLLVWAVGNITIDYSYMKQPNWFMVGANLFLAFIWYQGSVERERSTQVGTRNPERVDPFGFIFRWLSVTFLIFTLWLVIRYLLMPADMAARYSVSQQRLVEGWLRWATITAAAYPVYLFLIACDTMPPWYLPARNKRAAVSLPR